MKIVLSNVSFELDATDVDVLLEQLPRDVIRDYVIDCDLCDCSQTQLCRP